MPCYYHMLHIDLVRIQKDFEMFCSAGRKRDGNLHRLVSNVADYQVIFQSREVHQPEPALPVGKGPVPQCFEEDIDRDQGCA